MSHRRTSYWAASGSVQAVVCARLPHGDQRQLFRVPVRSGAAEVAGHPFST
ncbi:hypothetical protein [Streptomyces gelaticus]|uniref:hypothetical protein n=1 Tax=Streptomyces gelaticus TaxID=285446 RepID=UPI00167A52FF|nr:hypothetical protein [Streptomyces gelaticus]